ncbi:LptF/LptG family permease [Taklimakanibacter deserti]|uniref:LptF/LptG family permease n=1 Tax=Taklimakanibacter deserti TaxID=2267839 RepID=UPI0013C43F83
MRRFTIDRYIAGKVLVPLATTFGIGLIFLLADRVMGLLDRTIGKDNVLGVLFQMLAYLSPYYIGLAIPMALFLGVLLGFSRMSQDNEIDALQAAGIGLHRLSVPVALLSIVSLAAAVVVMGWLQPHGRYAYRALAYAVQNVEVYYLAEEGVFMRADNRTFILDGLDRANKRAQHVFIYEDRGPQKGVTTITAQAGQIHDAEGQGRPTLRLEHGSTLKIAPVPNLVAGPLKAPENSDFTTVDTPIGGVSDKAFRARGLDERELTLPELFARQASPPPDSSVNAMTAELHNRLVKMLTIPLLPLLAIPFALARSRVHRASNIGGAIILLFIYNHFIEQGAAATSGNGTSPWLSIWLPFAVMALFTAWRFWTACFTAKRDPFRSPYEWPQALVTERRWLNLPGKGANGVMHRS